MHHFEVNSKYINVESISKGDEIKRLAHVTIINASNKEIGLFFSFEKPNANLRCIFYLNTLYLENKSGI